MLEISWMIGDATPANSWTKWLLRIIKRQAWFIFSFLQFRAEDSLAAQESLKLQVQIKWDQRYLIWVLHGSNVLQNKLALFLFFFFFFNQFWVIDYPLSTITRDKTIFTTLAKAAYRFYIIINNPSCSTVKYVFSMFPSLLFKLLLQK